MRGTDNIGREPRSGSYVAYNMSGQIATGTIERLGRGRHGTIYYIRCSYPKWNEGKQSIVRGGAQCVLVLPHPCKQVLVEPTP